MTYWTTRIDVPPARLWRVAEWMAEPVSASLHAQAAREIAAGTPPESTEYARACGVSPFRLDGRNGADVLAGLLAGMSTGWRGDPVRAGIDALGRVVLTDGLHRSAAALAAGLPTVPVEIVWRDPAWWRVKHALRALSGGECRLYQAVDHPDLGWPAYRTDCERRAELIDALLPRRSRVTEIACNAGGVSLALARRGHEVTGLDTDPRAVLAANLLAGCEWIGASPGGAWFRECGPVADVHPCSAVVVLSLLNHHATDGRSAEGHEILRRCVAAAPLVVLDCPAPNTGAGAGSELADPAAMLAWCAAAGAPGSGRVLYERDGTTQRTLLAWERERG